MPHSKRQNSEHRENSNLTLSCSYPEQGKPQKMEADEYLLNPRAKVRCLCPRTLLTGRCFFFFFFFLFPEVLAQEHMKRKVFICPCNDLSVIAFAREVNKTGGVFSFFFSY